MSAGRSSGGILRYRDTGKADDMMAADGRRETEGIEPAIGSMGEDRAVRYYDTTTIMGKKQIP